MKYQKKVRSILLTAVSTALLVVSACGDRRPPTITDLRLDGPEENAPLAARVSFSTDELARATLELREGERAWSVTPSEAYETMHALPVLGLLPDTAHEIIVTVSDAAGNKTASAPLNLRTTPLPDDFPLLKVAVSRPDRMEPGVTVFGAQRWRDGGQVDDGYGLLVASMKPAASSGTTGLLTPLAKSAACVTGISSTPRT